jgi:hypothetical protein
MSEAQDVEQVVRAIESAFARVRLGDGVSISEGRVIDDYGSELERRKARMGDEKNDWRLIPDRAIRLHQSSLTFMDADGYRYNLPAYMRFAIRNYLTSESNSIDSVFYRLEDKDDERRNIFSPEQRAAVRKFLEFFVNEPKGWFRDQATRALANWV